MVLDCIGSAFNVKGAMQCPNCRKIEKGQWLYGTGSRSYPEFNMDDWAREEEAYDISFSEMVIETAAIVILVPVVFALSYMINSCDRYDVFVLFCSMSFWSLQTYLLLTCCVLLFLKMKDPIL